MKQIIERKRVKTGSGGWLDDTAMMEFHITIIESKSTGQKIRMFGHKDHFKAFEIQKRLRGYPKDVQNKFKEMSKLELLEDFGLRNKQIKNNN